MKSSHEISVAVSWLVFGTLFGAGPRPAFSSELVKVTVFADRAEITRRERARCEGGKGEARFFPLPLAIDARTLRGETSGKGRAIGTSSRELPLEANFDKRVEEARVEQRALEVKLQALQDAAMIDAERAKSLGGFEAYFRAVLVEAIRDPKPEPKKWFDVIEQTKKERLALSTAAVARHAEMRELERSRDVVQRRIAALQPQNAKAAREAIVAVECDGAAELDVELHYVIGAATWRPEYDLAFDAKSATGIGAGRAELTIGAIVQQSTGEDWSKVEVVLSTSKPRLGSEAPVPRALHLHGYAIEQKKVLVEAQERRESLKDAGRQTTQGNLQAALEDRGQSFTLTLPGKVTVIADGRPYWMPVDVIAADADARFVAVPKLRPYVYRMARLSNPAPYPLLAGKLHTYRNGSYVGDTWLEYKGLREPIEASLGIDEELRITRKSLTDKERRAGFLSGTKHLEQGWRIEVENRSRERAVVEVTENIPVSKDEKIEVELVGDKTTAGYELDKVRGFVVWKLDVQRGARKSVDLMHAVHLPKDWQVRP